MWVHVHMDQKEAVRAMHRCHVWVQVPVNHGPTCIRVCLRSVHRMRAIHVGLCMCMWVRHIVRSPHLCVCRRANSRGHHEIDARTQAWLQAYAWMCAIYLGQLYGCCHMVVGTFAVLDRVWVRNCWAL